MDIDEKKIDESPHKSSKISQEEIEKGFGNLLKGWAISDKAKKEFITNKITTQAPFSAKVEGRKNTSKELPANEIEKQCRKPDIVDTNKPEYTAKIENGFVKVDMALLGESINSLSPSERVMYLTLYRLSYGWGKNICSVGYTDLTKNTNLCKETVRKSIKRLVSRGYIEILRSDFKIKTVYRVYLPKEVPENIVNGTVLKYSTVLNNGTVPENSTVLKNGTGQYQKMVHPVPENGTVPFSEQSSNILTNNDLQTQKNQKKESIDILNRYIIDNTPPTPPRGKTGEGEEFVLKNKNEIINLVHDFYKKIGEAKISQGRITRGVFVIEGLLEEGYKLDEIKYALEWTISKEKTNIKNIKIIQETISQALKELELRKKIDANNKKLVQEREKEEYKRKEEEKINKEIDNYIKNLNATELNEIENVARKNLEAKGTQKGLGYDTLLLIEKRTIVRKLKEQAIK